MEQAPTVVVQPKRWTLSRTNWMAVLVALSGLLAAPEIVEWLGGVIGVRATAAVAAAVMVLMRLWTNAPIANSPGEEKAQWGR